MNKIYLNILKKAPMGYLILRIEDSKQDITIEDYNELLLDYLNIEDTITIKNTREIFSEILNEQLKEVVERVTIEGEVESVFFNNEDFINVYGINLEDNLVALVLSERASYLDNYKISDQTKLDLLENLPGMVYQCRYDKDWTMEYVSEGCKDLTGYDVESLIGNKEVSFNELIEEKYRIDLFNSWNEAVEANESVKIEYEIVTADSEKKWVYEQGQPVYDLEGNVLMLEGIIIDITPQKNREEKINYLTNYDAMTGVHNRRYYNYMIEKMDLETALPLSVIVGDINGLKLINDAFGHDYGDQLIIKTAELLRKSIRSTDILARTGGDEFVILLPNTPLEVTEKIVKRISEESHNKNITNEKSIVKVSISLGYATRVSMKEELSEIIKLAEDYMYRKKLLYHKSSHRSIIKSIRNSLLTSEEGSKENIIKKEKVAKKMGSKLDLDNKTIQQLKTLLIMYDIGKIAIDTEVLNKEGQLTLEEWDIIRKHPEMGYRIAMASKEFATIADYILSHHERWDGKGYPDGLKGEQIPILSRITAIIDSYDAMIKDKPYKQKISKTEAIDEIKNNAGTQFDPILAEIFIEIIQKL